MAGIHEECGVFGIFSPQRTDLAALSYYALYALQHRGQESAGIAINDDGVFSSCRDTGLVAEVFSPEKLIANHHTVEEIAAQIGADSLGYLSIEGVRRLPGKKDGLCTSCFDGKYPTSVPDDSGKSRFEYKIHEAGKRL